LPSFFANIFANRCTKNCLAKACINLSYRNQFTASTGAIFVELQFKCSHFMPKPSSFITGSMHQTIYQQLCASDPHVKKTLDRLLASVPMPLDAPCLGFVCAAAKNSLQAAFSLIPDLNQVAQNLLTDVASLDEACKEVYAERGAVDAFDTMFGRKTKYTGWTTLAFLGSHGVPITSGRLAAVGMELGIKLVSRDRKLGMKFKTIPPNTRLRHANCNQ
jgi:hypothetical protein